MLSLGRIWTFTACATLIVLGAAALALSLPGYQPRDFLARRLASQIPHASEAEVLTYVRRMTALGEEGIAATVRLLASERDCEAESAEAALREQVDRWRLLPRAESQPRVLHLAKVLSSQAASLPPRRRRYAADLATRLLLWPAADAAGAEELLTHCERTLRFTARPGQDANSSAAPAPAILASPPLSSPPRR
jgi:hypothetical protein